MKLTSRKSELNGSVRIPGSKSHTVRGLVFGLLANGESRLISPLDSSDTRAAIKTVRALGAEVVENSESWTINSKGAGKVIPTDIIDVMNSGTTLYVALAAAAIGNGYSVFTGDEQIRRRSAENLLKSLRDLGATAFSTRNNGCAPIVVGGPLKGGKTTIECPTSQYLTALLMACPFADGDSEIEVPLLFEKPYVQMTLDWMDSLGLKLERQGMEKFFIPGNQSVSGFEKEIAADFSTATFFLCAGTLAGGEVLLEGLDMNDPQGDKAVVDYLQTMGARIEKTERGLRVFGTKLHGAEIDLNSTPDALPAMAVTACFAEGETRLVNVPQARMKETDRIAVMYKELKSLGADIEELPDGLVIRGSALHGGAVHGHGDHRVVMSLAIAGMMLDDGVTIDTAEAVGVTFPDFAPMMTGLGADISTS